MAQSTCAHNGRKFCNYWIHHGLVNFKDAKMSKSEGNILLVRKLLENSPGEVIRLALITTHYRQPINWGDDVLNESKKKLDRLYGALRSVTDQIEEGEPSGKSNRGTQ